MSNVRYNVNIQYLNGSEENKREILNTRTIQSFQNLDEAIKKLRDIIIMDDDFATITIDEIKEDILKDRKELFDSGKELRWVKTCGPIFDCDGQKCYIGPGAYTISKVVLQ